MPEADHPRDVGGDDTHAMTYNDSAKARRIRREDDAGGDDAQPQQPAAGDVKDNIKDDVGADVRGDGAYVTSALEAAASGGREVIARADAETAREQATA